MSSIGDITYLMDEAFARSLDFSFPINGTSMRPFLYKDDIVRLRKCNKAKKGDIVFYKHGDTYILHRVRKVNKNGSYSIVGDHQLKCDDNVSNDMLIANVVAYKRKNGKKYHKLKGLRYFLYRFFVQFKLIRFINSRLF